MIDVLDILTKRKPYLGATAAPDDFAVRETGKADSTVVIKDPTISLYCLDHAARRALFVQVPEEIDVTVGPFLYMAQYEYAERVLAVPYEMFHHIAGGIELHAPLVLIYSTGRSGSTLMSKAFGETESVTSLSEPDVYTQAVGLRLSGCRDDEIRDLLTSATKLLFNPAFTRGSSLNVVKFRSFSIEIADLLSSTLPDAGNLFLYRDLAPFIRSRARAFGVLDRPPEVAQAVMKRVATMTPLLDKELKRCTNLDRIEGLCLMWLSALHAYARCRRHGIPMLAVWYEDLVADPALLLETILTYLSLPLEYVQNGLRAFAHDSQAGSPFAREEVAHRIVHIDDRQWELVRDLVRRYPVVGADIPAASFAVP